MYASETLIHRWFAHGSFRRDATLLFTSTALARGILVASLPLLARFFNPADVGNWQLFVGSATVLATVICWRYEVAVPLPSDEQKSRDLVSLCLLLAAGTSALLIAPSFFFRERYAALIGAAAIEPFLWCIPLFTLLYGCEQASTFWLTRVGDFRGVGASRVVKSTLMVAVPLVAAGAFNVGFSGLIAGTMLGQLAATAYLLREDQASGDLFRIDRQRLARCRAAMFEYRNYPLYVAPYAFVGQFSKRLVYFLLAAFSGSSTVGFFAMAMQLTYVPVTFITAALNQAFYRRAAAHADIRKLEPLVLRVLELQVVAAVPIFVLFVLHGEYVLHLALGPVWGEAVGFAKLLAVPSLMLFFTAWLDRLFDTLGRQRLAVALQLMYDAASIGILLTLLVIGYPTLVAVACYCMVTVLYNVLWLAIAFRIARFLPAGADGSRDLAAVLAGSAIAAHFLVAGLLDHPTALCFEIVAAIAAQQSRSAMSEVCTHEQFCTSLEVVLGRQDRSSAYQGRRRPLHSALPGIEHSVRGRRADARARDRLRQRCAVSTPGLRSRRRFTRESISRSRCSIDFKEQYPARHVDRGRRACVSGRRTIRFDFLERSRAVLRPRNVGGAFRARGGHARRRTGKFVCASVPWKCFRNRYRKGEFRRKQSGIVWSIAGFVRMILPDTIGAWFEWRDFERLAQKHGLTAKFYGSLHYPYRFHAVMSRQAADQSSRKAA